MIEKISLKLLSFLLQQNTIPNTPEHRTYYQYGIEITISSLLNILLILLIGLITQRIPESLVFLGCFVPLRKYTGGYHANSYFQCNLQFCLCFIAILLGNALPFAIPLVGKCGIMAGVLGIFAWRCPVENAKKPIPQQRRKVYKWLAVGMGIGYFGIGLWMEHYGGILLGTLVLVGLLVLVPASRR